MKTVDLHKISITELDGFTAIRNMIEAKDLYLEESFNQTPNFGLSIPNGTKLGTLIRDLIKVITSENSISRSESKFDSFFSDNNIILDFQDIYPSESKSELTSVRDYFLPQNETQVSLSSPKFNWNDIYKDISEDEICVSNDMHININIRSRIKPTKEKSVVDKEEYGTVINSIRHLKRYSNPRRLRKAIKFRGKHLRYQISNSQDDIRVKEILKKEISVSQDDITKRLLKNLRDEKLILEKELLQKMTNQYTEKQIFEETMMRVAEEYCQRTENMQQVATELKQKIENLTSRKDFLEAEILVLHAELEKEKLGTEELLQNLKIETEKLTAQLEEQALQIFENNRIITETAEEKKISEADIVRLQREVSVLTERMSTRDRANALTIKFAIENSLAQQQQQQRSTVPLLKSSQESSTTAESSPSSSTIRSSTSTANIQIAQYSSSKSPESILTIPKENAFDETQFDLYRKYSHMDEFI